MNLSNLQPTLYLEVAGIPLEDHTELGASIGTLLLLQAESWAFRVSPLVLA